MNYKTRIFFSALIGIGFAGCEQRDDQAMIKVYEVFQRDMEKRDETAKASMMQIQDEIKAVSDKLESLQKQAPGGGGGESAEKLAAAVADEVGKKLAEQNAAALADMKAQIAELRNAAPQPAAPSLPAPIAAAPAPPPPVTAPTAGPGVRYRDQSPVPAPPPPPTSTKSSDPSRKKYKIEF